MLRRAQLLLVGCVLLVAALVTGAQFLYFLVYLGAIVLIGAWLVTRLGLSGLEAGFGLDRPQAQVGDSVRAWYTLRNRGRVPKLWLEVASPSTLPEPIPGRALSLGPRATRSWFLDLPLTRRGHYRIDPMAIRWFILVRIADVILRLSPRQSRLIGKEAICNVDHGKHEEHFQHGGKICYKGKCYYLMLQETFCSN